jgi:hypothetical protein
MSNKNVMKPISAIKGLLAGAALVAGLAISTGQLTAANIGISSAGTVGLGAVTVGQPATVEGALFAASHPDVFARAGSTRDAFGFPVGSQRNGRHVHDGVQGSDYDEVSEVDSAGQAIALTQFANDGHLLAAVRFDSPPAAIGNVTSDTATKAAQRALSGAGITVVGQARTEANETSGGWDVHWARAQGGYSVRGDETRVHVWHDGSIQSVSRVEHQVAAGPTRLMVQADARAAVTKQCNAWFASPASGCALQGMDLEWVGPNAAFDAGKLGAASAPYKLAWVANVKPSGRAADYVQLITLYIDAGSGSVIGGDVVE